MPGAVLIGPLSSALGGPSQVDSPPRRRRRWGRPPKGTQDDDIAGEIATLLVDVARLQVALDRCVRDLDVIRNEPAALTEAHISALIGVLDGAVG